MMKRIRVIWDYYGDEIVLLSIALIVVGILSYAEFHSKYETLYQTLNNAVRELDGYYRSIVARIRG